MTVDRDDRDGGALIALTPDELTRLTRALAHEAWPEFGDGKVVRDLARGLIRLQSIDAAPTAKDR